MEIKDAFNEGSVPHPTSIFHGGSNENFVQECFLFSLLPNNNRDFIAFLIFGVEQNMKKNSLSIHIEARNIFSQNFNTNKNFYSVLLSQEDETKGIIPKHIS